jgi:hypothetical protein
MLFSCTGKKSDKSSSSSTQPESTAKMKTDSSVYISLVTGFNFRRTFADAQFMKDDKEIERYERQQEKSNPVLASYTYDTALLRQLEKFGIVKNKELLEHAFKKIRTAEFDIADVSGKKLHVSLKSSDSGGADTRVIAPDSCQIFFYPTDETGYLVKDLIPGGNPEILVLHTYYLILGYNFDLSVYEICYK